MLPFAHNNYEVYRNFRFMFGFFVTAVATTWLLANLRDFRLILWFWIGLICFQAFWAVTHDGRGYGNYLGDENDLALACDVAFPFAFVAAQRFRGSRRVLCAVVAIVLLVGVVSSSSRGGFLGLAAGALYCALASRKRLRNLCLLCVAGGIFFLAVPSTYRRELISIQETRTGTAENRLFLWTAATLMWMDHPVLGVGPFNAKYRMAEYNPKPTNGGLFASAYYTDRVWSMRAVHSLYFELLSERGIVGCLLFGWIAVRFYRGLHELRRAAAAGHLRQSRVARDAELYSLALQSSLASFLVAGSFLSMLAYPYFWFLTALGVALERGVRGALIYPMTPEEARFRIEGGWKVATSGEAVTSDPRSTRS
jgi:O-antigen ligase